MKKTFTTEDLIIPLLAQRNALGDPTKVRITIDDQYLCLYIGPRDLQWRLSDGAFVGAKTNCNERYLRNRRSCRSDGAQLRRLQGSQFLHRNKNNGTK